MKKTIKLELYLVQDYQKIGYTEEREFEYEKELDLRRQIDNAYTEIREILLSQLKAIIVKVDLAFNYKKK